MADTLRVEVVFATAERQRIVEVALPDGSTVSDAIGQSGMASYFPDDDLDSLEAGIWGRVVPRNQPLSNGDRVEIYRPLALDPREARRRLAAAGRTMRRPGGR